MRRPARVRKPPVVPALEPGAFPISIAAGAQALPVIVRGRWLQEDHYKLRNAVWGLRNARWAGQDEQQMLAWVVFEFRRLLDGGEPLESLVPSLAELFQRP